MLPRTSQNNHRNDGKSPKKLTAEQCSRVRKIRNERLEIFAKYGIDTTIRRPSLPINSTCYDWESITIIVHRQPVDTNKFSQTSRRKNQQLIYTTIAKMTNDWFSKRRRTNLLKRRRILNQQLGIQSQDKTTQRFSLFAGSSRKLKTQRCNYFERRRSTDVIQSQTLAKYKQQVIASKLTRSWTPSRNNETTTHTL
ncbi:hypothetical protein F511_27538 [Dorcoceras hygrometricum]|uniref:Uncharacterized protein n=1 Tax=Dorcoceras hygrometricum TaxID=472368 RepID=A0A2Z7ATW5_9LAMI|nr:hypothetical protein F511_27538 [Dorcoceras hygrometricum]